MTRAEPSPCPDTSPTATRTRPVLERRRSRSSRRSRPRRARWRRPGGTAPPPGRRTPGSSARWMPCATRISRSWRSFSRELACAASRSRWRARRRPRGRRGTRRRPGLEGPAPPVEQLEDADHLTRVRFLIGAHRIERVRKPLRWSVVGSKRAVGVGVVDADRLAGLRDRCPRCRARAAAGSSSCCVARRHDARPDLLAVRRHQVDGAALGVDGLRRRREEDARAARPGRGCRGAPWLASTRLFWRASSRASRVSRSAAGRGRRRGLTRGPPPPRGGPRGPPNGYVAVTTEEMPPRALKVPLTVMRRGAGHRDEVVEDAVDDGLVEDAAVAERAEVELQRLQLDAASRRARSARRPSRSRAGP